MAHLDNGDSLARRREGVVLAAERRPFDHLVCANNPPTPTHGPNGSDAPTTAPPLSKRMRGRARVGATPPLTPNLVRVRLGVSGSHRRVGTGGTCRTRAQRVRVVAPILLLRGPPHKPTHLRALFVGKGLVAKVCAAAVARVLALASAETLALVEDREPPEPGKKGWACEQGGLEKLQVEI